MKEIWKNSMIKEIRGSTEIQDNNSIFVKAENEGKIVIHSQKGLVYLAVDLDGERYVISNREGMTHLKGHDICWLLESDNAGLYRAVEIHAKGEIEVHSEAENILLTISANSCDLRIHELFPHADFCGNRYIFSFDGGEILEEALSRFYWESMLPSIVERTRAAGYPFWSGYVVSTLQKGEYAGTYPDVDHEFQCKGRLAMGDSFDAGVVRRMMNLQLKLMKNDPIGQWRNPCAVQPDGTIEYHVRRNSMDRKENAEMFLVTGNIEILETAWLYISQSNDISWLRENIEGLENAASLLEFLTDKKGRLWSDVFYEDQVMKDGMECMSAALAANALCRLAELEELLNRKEEAEKYRSFGRLLGNTMVKDIPNGFWDKENKRFVDWIDRHGGVHDHLHLLANCLPILFGYATPEQTEAVHKLIEENLPEFQRFPTFLSAKIQDYTDSEIGDGGPYDLCAAGRYWCWDAAYWGFLQNGEKLSEQLFTVAEQAKLDGFRMGERYDMNHVYYISDKNWHGAPYYYEYPCVFSWVLQHEYLGVSYDIKRNLKIAPKLISYGAIRLEAFGVSYSYEKDKFSIQNISDDEQKIELDISALYSLKANENQIFTLAAGEEKVFEIKEEIL